MPKTIGQLVDELFKTHQHPSGREFTYQEVSNGINNELDPTYIAKMRKGRVPNPGRNSLLLLCQFFEVEPSYFFPELAHRDLSNSSEIPVDEAIARAAADLPLESKNYLLDFINFIKKKSRN